MPELPEVETIRRGLEKYIVHKTIKKVTIICSKSLFLQNDLNQKNTIIGLRRFGKALVVDCDNDASMIIHLRMTGQLIYRGEENFAGGHPSENFVEELPNKQTRVVFEFSDGTKLFFNDQRKFGFVKFVKTEDVEKDEFIKKLAKEPWKMSGEELHAKLQKKKTTIKAALLDQTVVAGLGNIYVDETLYACGINPKTCACEIREKDAKNIINNARAVMDKSIELGGSTIRNYVNADGTRGNYLDKFAKVYGREGERCEKCGGKIKKIRVAGRGTYFCEECQK